MPTPFLSILSPSAPTAPSTPTRRVSLRFLAELQTLCWLLVAFLVLRFMLSQGGGGSEGVGRGGAGAQQAQGALYVQRAGQHMQQAGFGGPGYHRPL